MKDINGGSIILMGIKHCGKSTQGKLIASKLDLAFYDTDDVIAALTGKSARDIFSGQGEAAFKDAEICACRHVAGIVKKDGGRAVIATGGGICNNAPALEVLRPLGTFVFLIAPEQVAADRILKEARTQPDGTPENLPAYIAKRNPRSMDEARRMFHEFYEERTRLYAGIADCSVRMENDSKQANADRIISFINRS